MVGAYSRSRELRDTNLDNELSSESSEFLYASAITECI